LTIGQSAWISDNDRERISHTLLEFPSRKTSESTEAAGIGVSAVEVCSAGEIAGIRP
jgi:hypothetical protein